MYTFTARNCDRYATLALVANQLETDGDILAGNLAAAVVTALNGFEPDEYPDGRDFSDDADAVLSFWRECRDDSDYLDDQLLASYRVYWRNYWRSNTKLTETQIDELIDRIDQNLADYQVMQTSDGVVAVIDKGAFAGEESEVIETLWLSAMRKVDVLDLVE